MATQTFHITANDTLTPLGVQLKQRNTAGVLVAVDLTLYTVKFKMVDESGTVVIAETTVGVTVVDAEEGQVQFDFLPAQVTAPGAYWAWFIIYSGSESATFPVGRQLLIVIHKDE